MASPITSSDFENQTVGQPLCESFQEKLLNNGKMQQFLDWFVRDDDGEFAEGFITMLLNFLAPIGILVHHPKALASDVADPDNGAVWVEANGQKFLQADYERLFAVYGTTYNQVSDNPATEFRVPDYSGKFILGRSGSHAVNTTGGEEDVELTVAELPEHGHLLFANESAASTGSPSADDAVPRKATSTPSGADFEYEMQKASASSVEATLGKSSETGSGEAHENMPPYRTAVVYVLAGYKINGAMV